MEVVRKMTINFSELIPTEQKKAMLEQRVSQLALEGYQHQINLQTAESTENQDLINSSNEAIEIISSAITVAQSELESLN
jgi:hypothetical protein